LFKYPKAFIKDVHATEEAFSPQKRTYSTSKHKKFRKIFLIVWLIFALRFRNTAIGTFQRFRLIWFLWNGIRLVQTKFGSWNRRDQSFSW
jgi:hypothetical protein